MYSKYQNFNLFALGNQCLRYSIPTHCLDLNEQNIATKTENRHEKFGGRAPHVEKLGGTCPPHSPSGCADVRVGVGHQKREKDQEAHLNCYASAYKTTITRHETEPMR